MSSRSYPSRPSIYLFLLPNLPFPSERADTLRRGIARAGFRKNQRASKGWHSDITFEPVPSDYAILKVHTLPEVGGDTLWASGYEAYDRLSPALARFLEGLTAEHDGNFFHKVAKQDGRDILTERGAPENTGTDLRAVQ